jgi:hypothetical protein
VTVSRIRALDGAVPVDAGPNPDRFLTASLQGGKLDHPHADTS